MMEILLVQTTIHYCKYRFTSCRPSYLNTTRRFLRARQYNLKNAKIMWKNCYEWRKTAEGVGIDELYRRIDPFNVRLHVSSSRPQGSPCSQYPERNHFFKFWPLYFHKVLLFNS